MSNLFGKFYNRQRKTIYKMLILFGLYLVISNCMAEDLLDNLYGIHGGNKVTVCVAQDRACSGAVWMFHFVITRSSCLGEFESKSLAIEKVDSNCSDIKEWNKYNTASYVNNVAGFEDFALLRLDWPRYDTDSLPNQAVPLLEKLKVYDYEKSDVPTQKVLSTGINKYYLNQFVKITSTPTKIFLTTVVLPSIAFMVFFFFIFFFTGSNKARTTYRPLINTQNGSNI